MALLASSVMVRVVVPEVLPTPTRLPVPVPELTKPVITWLELTIREPELVPEPKVTMVVEGSQLPYVGAQGCAPLNTLVGP